MLRLAYEAFGFGQRLGRRWCAILAPQPLQFREADVADLERAFEDLGVVVRDPDKRLAIATGDRLGRGYRKHPVLTRGALCRGARWCGRGDPAPCILDDDVPLAGLRIVVGFHHRAVPGPELTEEGQERPVGMDELETADGTKERRRLRQRAGQLRRCPMHSSRRKEGLCDVADERLGIANGFHPNDVGPESRSRPLEKRVGLPVL
jgi:hypothetical protein